MQTHGEKEYASLTAGDFVKLEADIGEQFGFSSIHCIAFEGLQKDVCIWKNAYTAQAELAEARHCEIAELKSLIEQLEWLRDGLMSSLEAKCHEIDQWQPIETAPKDGTPILVANHVRGGSWIAYYAPQAQSGFVFENPWSSLMLNMRWHKTPYVSTIPTVWMPLPEPPK